VSSQILLTTFIKINLRKETPPSIIYHTPRPEPETPVADWRHDDNSTRRKDSISTSEHDQSKIATSLAEPRIDDQSSNHSNEFSLQSQEAADGRPALTKIVPTLSANCPFESLSQQLSSSVAISSAPGHCRSLNLGRMRSSDTSVPHDDPQGSSPLLKAQSGRQSLTYNSQTPNKRINGDFEVSGLSWKYRPVASILSTSVLAPVGLEMDLSFRNADSVEKHMIHAQTYGACGFTTLAEEEYMSAITECLEMGSDLRVRSCLHEITMFFKQDRTSDELKHSIFTCRKLVEVFDQDLSSKRGMTTSSLLMLADLFERDGQLTEAERAYRKALELTNESENFDFRQICETSLGKLLYRLWGSNEEVVREQLQNLSTLLQKKPRESTLLPALTAVMALKTPFSSICPLHPCSQLSSVTEEMSVLLTKRLTGRTSNFELRLRGLIMKLSLECLCLSWHNVSEALIATQTKLLDRMATVDWGYEKIRGYIECCEHLKRLREWDKCIESIITAYKTMEDLLYSRGVQTYRQGDLPLLGDLEAARARIPIGICSPTLIQLVEPMVRRLEKMVAWNHVSCPRVISQNVESDQESDEESRDDDGDDEKSDEDASEN